MERTATRRVFTFQMIKQFSLRAQLGQMPYNPFLRAERNSKDVPRFSARRFQHTSRKNLACFRVNHAVRLHRQFSIRASMMKVSGRSYHLVYFERRGNLALEYQLPAAASWADVVLLGKHNSGGSAVILELKDWTTAADRPGKAEGLIERMGRQELHPADQVRAYTEYCRRFHSAIDEKSKVAGCVLFTHQVYTDANTRAPNERLARNYPIFTTASEDVDNRFPEFFRTRLSETDEEFAIRFATGHYRQQRGFVAQIGAQILNPDSSPLS
jgi:hypothetical protein